MLLKLEVVGAQAGRLGEQRSKVFATEGGTIGRVGGNDWVLPDQFVSSRHAAIQYADGQFYVVDTNSSNGVFLNSPNFRLEQGRSYPLKSGDRLLIDPFEIQVSVIESAAPREAVASHSPETQAVSRSRSSGPPAPPQASYDPFAVEDEPFIGTLPAPASRESIREESLIPDSSDRDDDAVDPLVALGLPNAPRAPAPPRVEDLAQGSPLHSNFEPPRIIPSRTPEPQERPESDLEPIRAIPEDYNPLAQTSFERLVPKPAPPPPRRPAPQVRSDSRRPAPEPPPPPPREPAPARAAARPSPAAPRAPAAPAPAAPPPRPKPAPAPAASRPAPPRAPAAQAPVAAPPAPRAPAPRAPAPAAPAATPGQLDFAALLAAAGLEGVPVTPELAANFGSILKAVIDGLRDVLHAREELKDQFRLRITSYAPRENNPIKFSANTEDALHNLLVKHNAAYLGPVEAFEGAFDDLRIHQMAMLAGLRAGYEAMVGAFDPDALEQKFERYAKRGGILGSSGANKQRYWDLYRDVFKEMVGDADASFRTLFGQAFAEGYEEQSRLLKRRPPGQ